MGQTTGMQKIEDRRKSVLLLIIKPSKCHKPPGEQSAVNSCCTLELIWIHIFLLKFRN